MSKREPEIIEDEPYQGLFRGAARPNLREGMGDNLPGRFQLAEILKKTRASLGYSLDEVADITRVRRAYLEAFEQAAYDVLPPRAFAIGYIKAYAKALGLDEESLADMYKRETSETQSRLQAPSGASLEDVKPNYRLYIGAGVGLVLAIIVWNVFQWQSSIRAARGDDPAGVANTAWVMGVPNMRDGAIFVTRPAAPPKDQDVPVPYATPGLEAGFASIEAAKNSSSAAPVPVQDVLQMRKAFNPRGGVYGASPSNSTVTIQAQKNVNLVVRDGATIVFAQALGAGEAYRLPANDGQNLLIDVSDADGAAAMEMYYNGEYAGVLDSPVTPVGRINARAAQLSAQLDAHQIQTGQIVGATAARTPAPAPVLPGAPVKRTGPIPYAPSSVAASSSASAPTAPQ